MTNGAFIEKSPRMLDEEIKDHKKKIPSPWSTVPHEINEYEWLKVLESVNKSRRRTFWISVILVCYTVLEVLDYFFNWGPV